MEEIHSVEEDIRLVESLIKEASSKIDFQNLESHLSIYWLKEKEQLRKKEELLRKKE